MRDLSLHLLDLIENSLRASASVISVGLTLSFTKDLLTLRIEDNGPGFSAPPDVILNPFYTTKDAKRTGLGLSLLQSAARQAGGDLVIGTSSLGGARVEARMQLSHLDRSPLGDLAATFGTVACANPQVDLQLCLSSETDQWRLSRRQLAEGLPEGRRSDVAVARKFSELITAELPRVWPGAA